jgi:hypothetical protein
MSKLKTVVDILIEIDPWMGAFSSRSWLGDSYIKDKKDFAEKMVQQIKRHVDGAKYANIVEVTEDTCEFCGQPWTETSSTYNGDCCDKDAEAAP